MIARTVRRAGDLWFLAAAAGIFLAQQLAISFMSTEGAEGALRRTLFFFTTVALVLLAFRFRRYWGAWLVAAGIVLNLIPMAAHGGAMPIDYAILESSGAFPEVTRDDIGKQTNHGKDVVLERDDIHFFVLSDRYVVDLPVYGTNVYSLGDFVLFAGVAFILLQAPFVLLGPQHKETPQAAGAVGDREKARQISCPVSRCASGSQTVGPWQACAGDSVGVSVCCSLSGGAG